MSWRQIKLVGKRLSAVTASSRISNLIDKISGERNRDDVRGLEENFFDGIRGVEFDTTATVLAEDAARASDNVRKLFYSSQTLPQ